jgi:hypothetical protein
MSTANLPGRERGGLRRSCPLAYPCSRRVHGGGWTQPDRGSESIGLTAGAALLSARMQATTLLPAIRSTIDEESGMPSRQRVVLTVLSTCLAIALTACGTTTSRRPRRSRRRATRWTAARRRDGGGVARRELDQGRGADRPGQPVIGGRECERERRRSQLGQGHGAEERHGRREERGGQRTWRRDAGGRRGRCEGGRNVNERGRVASYPSHLSSGDAPWAMR